MTVILVNIRISVDFLAMYAWNDILGYVLSKKLLKSSVSYANGSNTMTVWYR
jgi:hypothetical protein